MKSKKWLLIDLKDPKKRYLVDTSKGKFSTAFGEIDVSSLVSGAIVNSRLGHPYIAFKPTLHDLIMLGVSRKTQIVYPKDSAYISLKLGLTNGMRVFECGTGSGAMTMVLANAVAPDGKVVSYEKDERFFKLAQKNIEMVGLTEFVEIYMRDISEKIDGGPYDSAFIDVREPWLYIENIRDCLVDGAPVAFVLPTTNQIQELLTVLPRFFAEIEVAENIMRFYKPVAERLRPTDRMVAHTTYMIFARKLAGK